MLRQRIPHPVKQIMFVLLSLADLALTWWLLSSSAGGVYEANPLANWLLARHGWLGLAGFKTAMVVLVIGLVGLIARTRPRAAGRVLGFGCAAVAVVVLYSASLCGAGLVSRWDEQAEVARKCAEITRQSTAMHRQGDAYRAVLQELADDVSADRCGLREAAKHLAATEGGKDQHWLQALARLHAGRTPQESLAAHVSVHAVVSVEGHRHTARNLEREFQHAYGSPLHLPVALWLPTARTADSGEGRPSSHFSESR
jgi:hypothetical protein